MTFVTHPNQKRSACERCRRQKLRCSRQDSDRDSRCSRCSRLGFPCVSGQQRRIGRPSRAEVQKRTYDSPNEHRIEDDSLERSPTGRWDGGAAITPSEVPLEEGMLPGELALLEPTVGVGVDETDAEVDVDSFFCDFVWDETALEPEAVGECTETLGFEVRPVRTVNPTAQHEAMAKISKINLDLHSHISRINAHRESLDLCSFIYPSSVLSVASVTVVELGLILFQDFVHTLSSLEKTVTTSAAFPALQSHHDLPRLPWDSEDGTPATLDSSNLQDNSSLAAAVHCPESAMTGVVDAPLALTITSCYVQIITLFEHISRHILTRLESVFDVPLTPIEGLKFGAMWIADGHLQGLMFAQIITSLFDKADRLLGLGTPTTSTIPASSPGALLSEKQSELLRDQLKSTVSGEPVLRSEKLKRDADSMLRCLRKASAAS
ncbi:hypothetical protein CkaCkLH20_07994 [Colletotrichum karsti]|uniref:Zn(2)-C6 fungal-type domain-containing protein n=1 Tax=Colletotrichum karsti TaxID=1095194 RepID=A0A9P6I5N3_9PEZI|nr:uncharacterized protein CkaCkLH20_07994 [Colletotrichum karsti]KAF9874431.1 hypothetical protein CkaCkLH20_07994 [Colletotrichum karsti]